MLEVKKSIKIWILDHCNILVVICSVPAATGSILVSILLKIRILAFPDIALAPGPQGVPVYYHFDRTDGSPKKCGTNRGSENEGLRMPGKNNQTKGNDAVFLD